MKYLQCEMLLTTSGRTIEDIKLNARAITRCKYDMDGKLHG